MAGWWVQAVLLNSLSTVMYRERDFANRVQDIESDVYDYVVDRDRKACLGHPFWCSTSRPRRKQ